MEIPCNVIYRRQVGGVHWPAGALDRGVLYVAMMNKRRRVAVIAAVGLALVAIPIPTLHCPDWTVTVLDQSGRPVPGGLVRLGYTNYSAEGEHHRIDRITDESGQAAFERRTLYASSLRRAYYILLSARAGVHASFGPSATVTAFGDGMEGYDVDPNTDTLVFWHGQPNPMASKIIMKPARIP